MLDEKHINIIVRAIMPELYRLQGIHNNYSDILKQRQESRPKVSCESMAEGIHWVRTKKPDKTADCERN